MSTYFHRLYFQSFPKGGGGFLRRYMNVRHQLLLKWLDAGKHPKPGPLPLLDLSQRDDAADAMRVNGGEDGWRVSADSETLSGYSKCYMRFVATSEEYKRILQDGELLPNDKVERPTNKDDDDYKIIRFSNDVIKDEENDTHDDDTNDNFVPFIRWWGTLDTRLGKRTDAIRSGYCSMMTPLVPFEGHNLSNWFNHLELTVRADGRPYCINMKISTYFEDDLYVFTVRPIGIHSDESKNVETGGEFTTLFIPFKSFILTCNGRVRETQRRLDAGIRIESIGFTIMDGQDGDFCFDLARIRAVNYDANSAQLYGEDDTEEPY